MTKKWPVQDAVSVDHLQSCQAVLLHRYQPVQGPVEAVSVAHLQSCQAILLHRLQRLLVSTLTWRDVQAPLQGCYVVRHLQEVMQFLKIKQVGSVEIIITLFPLTSTF
jgi:hypothetical protein